MAIPAIAPATPDKELSSEMVMDINRENQYVNTQIMNDVRNIMDAVSYQRVGDTNQLTIARGYNQL